MRQVSLSMQLVNLELLGNISTSRLFEVCFSICSLHNRFDWIQMVQSSSQLYAEQNTTCKRSAQLGCMTWCDLLMARGCGSNVHPPPLVVPVLQEGDSIVDVAVLEH